jgi:hypothetical protein
MPHATRAFVDATQRLSKASPAPYVSPSKHEAECLCKRSVQHQGSSGRKARLGGEQRATRVEPRFSRPPPRALCISGRSDTPSTFKPSEQPRPPHPRLEMPVKTTIKAAVKPGDGAVVRCVRLRHGSPPAVAVQLLNARLHLAGGKPRDATPLQQARKAASWRSRATHGTAPSSPAQAESPAPSN